MNRLVVGLVLVIVVLVAALMLLGRSTTPPESQTVNPTVSLKEPSNVAKVDAVETEQPAARSAPTQVDPGGEARANHIPSIFLGTWAIGRGDCTTTGETTRVSIRATELEFYESTGRVQRVAPVDEGREYVVRLSFAGEGQIWDGTIYLRRAALSLTLRDAEDEEARVYIRC